VDLKEGMFMAKVKVDIGGGNIVSAIITVEAAKELGVKVGEELAVSSKPPASWSPRIFADFSGGKTRR
jgi:molybdopterin-binding protein